MNTYKNNDLNSLVLENDVKRTQMILEKAKENSIDVDFEKLLKLSKSKEMENVILRYYFKRYSVKAILSKELKKLYNRLNNEVSSLW